MSDSDVSQIKDRLTKLETIFEEKWRSHDVRAEERNEVIVDRLNGLSGKLDHRPCVEHGELMLGLNHRVTSLEQWLGRMLWAVGVIYVGFIGALIKHFFS